MEKIKETKLIEFSFRDNPAIENYWDYCVQRKIPYIEIVSIDEDFVNVSYDLLPSLPFEKLQGNLLEAISKIYESYHDFYKLPRDKFNFAGGDVASGATVRKEHSETIARQLFGYLSDFVRINKVSI